MIANGEPTNEAGRNWPGLFHGTAPRRSPAVLPSSTGAPRSRPASPARGPLYHGDAGTADSGQVESRPPRPPANDPGPRGGGQQGQRRRLRERLTTGVPRVRRRPAHLPLGTISDARAGRSPRPFFSILTAVSTPCSSWACSCDAQVTSVQRKYLAGGEYPPHGQMARP
jgi:hypothetical protein